MIKLKLVEKKSDLNFGDLVQVNDYDGMGIYRINCIDGNSLRAVSPDPKLINSFSMDLNIDKQIKNKSMRVFYVEK